MAAHAAALRLALAGLSGRRLCLFAWARMGGGGRRRASMRRASRAGSPICSSMAAGATTRSCSPRPTGRAADDRTRSPSSPNSPWRCATSAERRLETATQGDAFVDAIANPGPARRSSASGRRWPGSVAYPVAVGVAAAGHGIPLEDALEAFALAFVGQSRLGRRAPRDRSARPTASASRAALDPRIASAAAFAPLARPWTISAARPSGSDLAALRHETQYTRLFRS